MAEKIDLEEITNNRKYAEVAYFVDNDLFLDEVDRLRKVIKIDSPLEYSEAKEWLHKRFNETSFSKMNETNKKAIQKRLKLLINVGVIKNKFKKGINFTNIITYAILAGKVTDRECAPSAFCETYPFPKEFENAEVFSEEPMVAIFVNPETNINEVEELMKTKVKNLFKKSERYIKKSNINQDIRDIRKLYWMHKNGKSNKDIGDKYGIEESGISKKIIRYKAKILQHSGQ